MGRRKVVHVPTGQIFDSAAAAERAFNLPESVLSESIRLGRLCHGEKFEFYEGQDITNVKAAEVESPLPATTRVDSTRCYRPIERTSCKDKASTCEQLIASGYNCKLVDGVICFYGHTKDEVLEAVKSANYDASFGICPITASRDAVRDRERYNYI